MLYVGLDVHSRQSSLCILNASGGIVNQVQLKGPRATVVDRLRQLAQPFSICYEASCGYGHLYESLRPLAAKRGMAPPQARRRVDGSQSPEHHSLELDNGLLIDGRAGVSDTLSNHPDRDTRPVRCNGWLAALRMLRDFVR